MGFSFGGPGSSMMDSIKNNEKQRKRRQHFDKDKTGGFGEVDKPDYNFPEATPQVLREIRNKMEQQRRKFLHRASIVGALFLTLAIVGLILLG